MKNNIFCFKKIYEQKKKKRWNKSNISFELQTHLY